MKTYDVTVTRGELEEDDEKMLEAMGDYCKEKNSCDGCIFMVEKDRCIRSAISKYLKSLSIN